MTALAAPLADSRADPLGWRPHLTLLGAAWGALILLFARDATDVVAIWWDSSTYGHCLFLPPIITWLVWVRRDELARIGPRGWAPGLLLVGAGAGGWLLGEAGGVAVARHLALCLMLEGAVLTALGPAVARGLLFPLAYMLFLVPAGDGLVPSLQTLTARMCMGLLHLVGVPARLDGVFITTPSGWFEVAEACSGVKFLVAMAAYGTLGANVCFVRWRRRAAFLAAALIVPVLANGVRAFATIYVAGRTSLGFADGFDHVVYGWIFFGVVIAGLMAAFRPWFDRPRRDRWIDAAAIDPTPRRHDARRAATLLAALLGIAAAAPGWSALVAARGTEAIARIDLPAVPGWTRVAIGGPSAWSPAFAAPDHSLIGRYRDADGHEVDLAVVVYLRQDDRRELVRTGQGAAGGGWLWTADLVPPPGGRAERIVDPSRVERIVASFYRVGGVTTGSDMRVKLETLRVRLLGGPQRAVAVLVSAREPGARRAIDTFLRDLGPVDAMLDRLPGAPTHPRPAA